MAGDVKELKWVGKRNIRPDGIGKVTGRDKFGADYSLPGMLTGKVLRSPHANANIKSINTDKAKALAGVKAVITGADFPDLKPGEDLVGEGMLSMRDLGHNCIARERAMYEGHAVAAVAAVSIEVAEAALALIEVDYEVLPHVIDADEAMADGAPLVNPDIFTQGVEPTPETPSNVAKRVELGLGDVEAGFAKADIVVEESYTTKPVHQGYIEPHACLASVNEDGQSTIWCSSQGHFMVRAYSATILGWDLSELRVIPAEIGGGFGGKTVVYLEPLALLLSQLSGRPVKMVMTREEVFIGSGPTSGGSLTVKVGVTKDGTIVAAETEIKLQAGPFGGSPIQPACMCAFACYDVENVKVVGYDVAVNRPRVAAYRAPGSPISAFGVESTMDLVARKLEMDPIEFRLKNAAREGTQAAYGPRFPVIGNVEQLQAAQAHPNLNEPLGENQGRGIASGFWFNIGGDSSAQVNINEDGTVVLATGSPDIGGSRTSMAAMAAEVLGIDYERVRPIVGDTSSVGYTFLTGGSRVTFATGMATVQASQEAVKELCARAAKVWEVEPDQVVWEDGHARPASANVGDFEPMSLEQIAVDSTRTGGPIGGRASITAQGAGAGFGTHICDVEVDKETGKVTVLRYTVAQDVGRAISPGYVEGQLQGGAAQGIGWALNEEYIYDADGRMENPGFLDYRIPVASDLPMIDTVIVEVPNPTHPYGVRGVGEVPICPPLAAVANAVHDAIGIRMTDLPLSPPKVLAAIDAEE